VGLEGLMLTDEDIYRKTQLIQNYKKLGLDPFPIPYREGKPYKRRSKGGSSALLVMPGLTKAFHLINIGAILSFALTDCK